MTVDRATSVTAGERLRVGELVYIERRRVWWKPWTWFLRPLAFRVTSVEPDSTTMTYFSDDQP